MDHGLGVGDRGAFGWRQGELTLLKRTRLPGAQRVYNMTVEEEHVYHVSLLGALVHNNKCFPPGTLVLMADRSTKRIEDVRQGDLVLSTDPAVRVPRQPGRVAATVKDWTQCLVHIAISRADGSASERELVATRWHPIWTKNRKWQNAVDIQPGDTLQDDRGAGIRVLSTRQEWRISDSYNFSVPGVHTYFVVIGGTPILVHNADLVPISPGGPPPAPPGGPPPEPPGGPPPEPPDQLYFILNGVRRSKAADLLGKDTIPATIQQRGLPDTNAQLRLGDLRTTKSEIPIDSRWLDKNFIPATKNFGAPADRSATRIG